MSVALEGEALVTPVFCGRSEIDNGRPGIPSSLVTAFAVPCDLIGAKVIWEVYM